MLLSVSSLLVLSTMLANLFLPEDPEAPNTAAEGTIECKFWGIGGDGTVGGNKQPIKTW